jgi:hypothetical protein
MKREFKYTSKGTAQVNGMKRIGQLAACIAALLLPAYAHAGTVWQQLPDSNASAYINQEFSDFLTFSTYQVNDVTSTGWLITSITEWFGQGGQSWPNVVPVRLNIFSKSASLPSVADDPSTGTLYSASYDSGDGSMTLSGLSIALAAGDYWIGFTPVLPYGVYGQEFHFTSSNVIGDYSAARNAGGGFGFGTDWVTTSVFGAGPNTDAAIQIDATSLATPEPGTMTLLGSTMAGIVFLRRRR